MMLNVVLLRLLSGDMLAMVSLAMMSLASAMVVATFMIARSSKFRGWRVGAEILRCAQDDNSEG
jgi:hypothetical protein